MMDIRFLTEKLTTNAQNALIYHVAAILQLQISYYHASSPAECPDYA